ncbi:hypothetical protein HYV85_00980 [Candidatus Woesearchaeota archaeon]|nr:hypothetical protein [Candidatus Woesearchaeota archaeon]
MSTLQFNKKSKALANYAAARGSPFQGAEGSFQVTAKYDGGEINVTFHNPKKADLKTSAEGTALEIILTQDPERSQVAVEDGLTGKCVYLRLTFIKEPGVMEFLASKATLEHQGIMQGKYQTMLNKAYEVFCGRPVTVAEHLVNQ